MFVLGHLGIQGELKHAEYINTWIQLLKNDDRAIITSASLASKAADCSSVLRDKGGSGMTRINRASVKRLENLILQLDAAFSDIERARAKDCLARDMPLLH